MFKNNLLIALRSLRKHLTYSLINVLGLGLGLATCMLLSIWIWHELSFDRFHKNSSRIYRASLEYSFGGQVARTSVSPSALLPALQKNFAEVENGVRVYNPSGWVPYIIKKDDKLFQEKKFYYADSTFFHVFSFQLLQGNPAKALSEPNSVILSQAIAKKYFGDEEPMGKTILVNNKSDYRVTGIIEDAPSNSLLQYDFIASFSSLDASKEPSWWSANYQTFVLVNPNTDIKQLSGKVKQFVKKELASELTNPGDYVVYNFIPYTDIYLRSDNNDEPEVTGSILYIYIFSTIAFLILVVASINYINLSTAKAVDRAREVGIRKVVGAVQRQLFLQFISESFLITFFGFMLALLLAALCLPLFNTLTGKHFNYNVLMNSSFLLLCLVGWLLISFVAGAYPSLAITSFKPSAVLKGKFQNTGGGIRLRQALVVFQFSISIILMASTIIIIKQLNFIQNKRLGYDKENILILPLDRKTGVVYDQLKNEFLRSGKVISMGRAIESPTKIRGGYGLMVEGKSDHSMVVTANAIDKDFIPTLNMTIIEGRNLNDTDIQKLTSDTINSFILNESALKELGIPKEKALGTKVSMDNRKGEIIGVVKDFHFNSLHQKINPLVLFMEDWQLHYIFVRIKPEDLNETLATLKSISNTLLPHRPFEYDFLDQQYQGMYDKEQRMGTVCTVFAGLTIIIACLGLLGLVAFSAAQKTKEIGVRKVLGASAANIVFLITKDYGKLILTAILIGIPASYWTIEKWWMSDFVYRTSIGLSPFVLASVASLAIAFTTASYQAIKAALINPAKTLRNE